MEEDNQTHLMKVVNTLMEAQLQAAIGGSADAAEPQVVLVITDDNEQYEELHTITQQEAYQNHSGGDVVFNIVEVDGDEGGTSLEQTAATGGLGATEQDEEVATLTLQAKTKGSDEETVTEEIVEEVHTVVLPFDSDRVNSAGKEIDNMSDAENESDVDIGEKHGSDNWGINSDKINIKYENKDKEIISNVEDREKASIANLNSDIQNSANRNVQEAAIGNDELRDQNKEHHCCMSGAIIGNHKRDISEDEVVDDVDIKPPVGCSVLADPDDSRASKELPAISLELTSSENPSVADSLHIKVRRRKGRPKKHEGIKILKMECPLLNISVAKQPVSETKLKPSEVKSNTSFVGTRRRMKALEQQMNSGESELTGSSEEVEKAAFKRNSRTQVLPEMLQKRGRRKRKQSAAVLELLKKTHRRNSNRVDDSTESLKRPRVILKRSQALKKPRGRKSAEAGKPVGMVKKPRRRKGNYAEKFMGTLKKSGGRKKSQAEESPVTVKKVRGRKKREVFQDIIEIEEVIEKKGMKEKEKRKGRNKTIISCKRKSEEAIPVTLKRTRGRSRKEVPQKEYSERLKSDLEDTEGNGVIQTGVKKLFNTKSIQGITTSKKETSKMKKVEEKQESETESIPMEVTEESEWECAVCAEKFDDTALLSQHHLTHSAEDLSRALCMLQAKTPPKKYKPKLPGRKGRKPKEVFSKEEAQLPQELCQTELTTDEAVTNKVVTVKQEITDNMWNDDWNNDNENFEWPDDSNSFWSLQSEDEGEEVIVTVVDEEAKTDPEAKKVQVGKENTEKKQRRKSRNIDGLGSRDPHVCVVCGKTLSSRGNLTKHLILHNTAKPWMCDKCGVGFNAKRDFGHHMMQKHTGERPYVCEVCGKGFVYKNYLTEHANYHTNEKPYICEWCGKYFASVNCLKKHQKRHTGERPFVCGLCGKAFAIRYDLTAHMKTVHEGMKKKKTNSNSDISLMKSQMDDELQLVKPPVLQLPISVSPTTILPDSLDTEPISQNTGMHSDCVYQSVLPVVTHPSSLPGPSTPQSAMLFSEAGITNIPTIATSTAREVQQEVASVAAQHSAAQQMIVMQYM